MFFKNLGGIGVPTVGIFEDIKRIDW